VKVSRSRTRDNQNSFGVCWSNFGVPSENSSASAIGHESLTTTEVAAIPTRARGRQHPRGAHLSAQHVLSQTLVIPHWGHVFPAIGRLVRVIVLQCTP
jgi:hypothetical protein